MRPLRAAGLVALVAAVVAALLMPPSAGAARPLRSARRGRVAIEQRGSSWHRVATLRANRYGIFTDVLKTSKHGFMRARLLAPSAQVGERSVPFSLRRVPDRSVNPFG